MSTPSFVIAARITPRPGIDRVDPAEYFSGAAVRQAVLDAETAGAAFVLLDDVTGDRWAGAFENGSWHMSAWSPVSRKDARDLWLKAADALAEAWLGPSPRLNTATTRALPVSVPSGIEGLWRFDGTVRASVRA